MGGRTHERLHGWDRTIGAPWQISGVAAWWLLRPSKGGTMARDEHGGIWEGKHGC
jgi:hypothetical protein